ncbi:MAG: DUF951 domain-containing protein [Bacillota bacterium]|nr:DUF951 domain-containing protein [Bacillota bacterium]
MSDPPERIPYRIGDVVRLRKTHPCGSTDWEVTRTGIDFGLKCLGCGRRVMIPRTKFERAVKQVLKHGDGILRFPGLPGS